MEIDITLINVLLISIFVLINLITVDLNLKLYTKYFKNKSIGNRMKSKENKDS